MTVEPAEPAEPVAVLRERAEALAGRVVALALAGPVTIAVAESLTAGLVAGTLASVPGVSAVLRGGVVAYATDLKTALLGVDARLLSRGGAVQAAVADAMAAGVADRLQADIGVATTGVAGPDPQDGQAPGTVYVAAIGPAGRESVACVADSALTGDRGQVRWASVVLALELLERLLRRDPEEAGVIHG